MKYFWQSLLVVFLFAPNLTQGQTVGFRYLSSIVTESPTGEVTVDIPIESPTPIAGAAVQVQMSVLPTSTATLDMDYKLPPTPGILFVTNILPVGQNSTTVQIKILNDGKKETDEKLLLDLQIVGLAPGINITPGKQTHILTIKDAPREDVDEDVPLRVGLGTNLNVLNKAAIGPNVYFDLIGFDDKIFPLKLPGKLSFIKGFGGYVRVFQQQGVEVNSEPEVGVSQMVQPQVPVVKFLSMNKRGDSVRAARDYVRFKANTPVVRSTGFTVGAHMLITEFEDKPKGMSFSQGVGIHFESVRRETSFNYSKTSILKDTTTMPVTQFLNQPLVPDTNIIRRYDQYYGISIPTKYRRNNLELWLIPAIGGTKTSRLMRTTFIDSTSGPRPFPREAFVQKPTVNLYTSVYAVLTEHKLGITLGCDLRLYPLNSTVINFNVFISKVFKLDKVAEALKLTP